MSLDSLLSLVEKLRERIDAHGRDLRKNEALTRAALIDPLLRELGWDTEDPALVIPEYKVDNEKADYALFRDGKRIPIMMVEAKRLGTALRGEPREQGFGYCLLKKIPYLSISDGEHWEIYRDTDTARGDPDEKRIVQFDLKNSSATETCLKAAALWELRVSGRIDRGQTPVVAPTPPPPARPGSPNEWQPISELNPPPYSKPTAVQFPDNQTEQVKEWKLLLAEVTRWLLDNRYLTPNDCPLQMPGRARYVVATTPYHPDKKSFTASVEVGAIYVETNLGSGDIVRAARFIIERVGQDPAQFKVKVPSNH